jgi:anti-sigma B factor antagonist
MQAQENDENLPVLRLKGEIDLSNSSELRTRLQQHVKAKCPALVLDFTEVTYIDSSGLATIIEYLKHARVFRRPYRAGSGQRAGADHLRAGQAA